MECVVNKNVAVAPLCNKYTPNIMTLVFWMVTRAGMGINNKSCN